MIVCVADVEVILGDLLQVGRGGVQFLKSHWSAAAGYHRT